MLLTMEAGTERSATRALAGAAIGAAAGVFAGALAALIGGFLLIFFAFVENDDAWWARVLIRPPAIWLLLGGLSGATIGLLVARSRDRTGRPKRPDDS